MAAVPIWIHLADERKEQRQTQQQQLRQEQRQLENGSPEQAPETGAQSGTAPDEPGGRGDVARPTGAPRAGVPFLQLSDSPGWGAMGLVDPLLWNENRVEDNQGRPLQIFGPFDSTAAAAIALKKSASLIVADSLA